ncbi:hypothetical protein N4S13_16900 (plasmid) [Enterococcus raffinosus]|uniref:hypothetical protein n=1 Tax=Enterococcus raffinosus TaxID=71452 RepID=UPI0021B3F865|nr:hypothetical protein [Enterococcus raffinosus]UXC27807.1 hypothetical protein N4S13_16900 [Enterococcus raffinosus]
MNKQEVIKKINLEMFAHPTWKPEDADAPTPDFKDGYNAASKANIKIINQLDEPTKGIAHLAEKWHEDIGPVLWWDFPVEEPPYCGTPLDDDFPKYKRHFTELHIPDEVEEEPKWVVKIEDNGSAYFVDFFDELQPHLVYGLSGEVMRFDSEDKANAIFTLIECGTVEKV